MHTGDLDWWLYYAEPESAPWQHIYLWEAGAGESALDGWALLSPAWSTFDVFLQPDLRGSPQAEAMLAYAEGRIAGITRQRGGKEISTLWVGEGDDVLIPYLQAHGFSLAESFMVLYERSLEPPPDLPALPAGFCLGHVEGEDLARSRADASHAAFGSNWDRQRYLQRYLDLLRSPVYRPDLDVVSIAPDGRVASFCIAWLNGINRVGLVRAGRCYSGFRAWGWAGLCWQRVCGG